MSHLSPPKWLSGLELNELEDKKEIKLLELTTRKFDGLTYIATIYRPSISLEQQRRNKNCAPSKGISCFVYRFRKICLNVLINLKVIKSQD